MVIHIERTGFDVLVRIVTNDSRCKISWFKRNMSAYESVLSGLKNKVDTQISPRNIVNMPIIIELNLKFIYQRSGFQNISIWHKDLLSESMF